MNDTSKIIDKIYYSKLTKLSGEERIKIASDSFNTARDLVVSSINYFENDFTLRKELLLRFYGTELTQKQIDEFLSKSQKVSSISGI